MRMEQGARIIVERWLFAQPEDVLHFITDETQLREAGAFCQAARQVGAIPKLTVLNADSVQAGSSVEEMQRIMSYATAIVGATSQSFITTGAVEYALRRGARFLSVPMAANFNVMPAALLETKRKYAVIKAQLPVAIIMLVIHIVLMYLLAF